MTLECFAKGIAIFLATFANVRVPEETQKMWRRLLIDLSDSEYLFAIEKICREIKSFYPTDNLVALIREQITVKVEEKSLFAWEAVLKAMKKYGAYNSVKFNDPIIHSVIPIMAGSWADFCHIPLDKWMQKEFINNYKIMGKRNEHPEYLKGICEIENTANGYLNFVGKPIEIDIGVNKDFRSLEDKYPLTQKNINKPAETLLEHISI